MLTEQKNYKVVPNRKGRVKPQKLMIFKMNTYAAIKIKDLELNVHLGWPEAEKLKSQVVIINVDIQFISPPKACVTDDLEDTFCYDKLTNVIKNTVSNKKYNLVEHLGYELYHTIKSAMAHDTHVRIRVNKKPAIVNLTGGIEFCLGDM